MPVVINEIVITAEVGKSAAPPQNVPAAATPPGHQAAVVAACVEQVLKILSEKAER